MALTAPPPTPVEETREYRAVPLDPEIRTDPELVWSARVWSLSSRSWDPVLDWDAHLPLLSARGLRLSTDRHEPVVESRLDRRWYFFGSVPAFALTFLLTSLLLVWTNDAFAFNAVLFYTVHVWVDWFLVLQYLFGFFCTYFLVLVMAGSVLNLYQHAALEHLHLVHKATSSIFVLFSSAIILFFLFFGSGAYLELLLIYTQYFSPIIHLCTVALIFVAGLFLLLQRPSARLARVQPWHFVPALSLVLWILLIPPFLTSQAITDTLPPKPFLVGHRGAASLAPENTLESMRVAARVPTVWALETDVRPSRDEVLFLLHDAKVRRTSNLDKVFPARVNARHRGFNYTEIETLDAGSFFVRDNPFQRNHKIDEADLESFRGARMPRFVEFLQTAEDLDLFALFDVRDHGRESPGELADLLELVWDDIVASGINRSRVLWLDDVNRESFAARGPEMTQVAGDAAPIAALVRNNITLVNIQWNDARRGYIDKAHAAGIRVNCWTVDESWLFSALWLVGVDSVTTNKPDVLHGIDAPVFHLSSSDYLAIWVSAEAVTAIVVGLVALKWEIIRGRRDMIKKMVAN